MSVPHKEFIPKLSITLLDFQKLAIIRKTTPLILELQISFLTNMNIQKFVVNII